MYVQCVLFFTNLHPSLDHRDANDTPTSATPHHTTRNGFLRRRYVQATMEGSTQLPRPCVAAFMRVHATPSYVPPASASCPSRRQPWHPSFHHACFCTCDHPSSHIRKLEGKLQVESQKLVVRRPPNHSRPPLPSLPPPPLPPIFITEDTVERTLCQIRSVHVFKIPPRVSAGGYRASDWKEEVWQGALKLVQKGYVEFAGG